MAHRHETTSTEQATPAPALCAGGCGFYGCATTGNMCSKCYLRHLKTTTTTPRLASPAGETTTTSSEVPVAAAKVAPITRCMACKKKVGLLGFACRCGGTFCSHHRYDDGHVCTLDYKKVGREKIAEQNPLVVAPKITKF